MVEFLQTATPWFVDGWNVSSMSDSSDIKLGLETRLMWAWECRVLICRGRGMEDGQP